MTTNTEAKRLIEAHKRVAEEFAIKQNIDIAKNSERTTKEREAQVVFQRLLAFLGIKTTRDIVAFGDVYLSMHSDFNGDFVFTEYRTIASRNFVQLSLWNHVTNQRYYMQYEVCSNGQGSWLPRDITDYDSYSLLVLIRSMGGDI